jgi:diguanylate cyclase
MEASWDFGHATGDKAISEVGAPAAASRSQRGHRRSHQRKRVRHRGRYDPYTYVTVNASPVQFRYPNFVEHVMAAVAVAGIAPSSLVLEVTETGLMTDLDANIVALDSLRATGVRIAISDFGTGYSSIAYLKGLPLDIVKIDRSLVPAGTASLKDWEMTRAIAALVDAVGLDTVIEGVEEASQAERLAALGAETAQGYHFARPMPADQMAELFTQQVALRVGD